MGICVYAYSIVVVLMIVSDVCGSMLKSVEIAVHIYMRELVYTLTHTGTIRFLKRDYNYKLNQVKVKSIFENSPPLNSNNHQYH